MKQDKFIVYFKNGNEETIYAFSYYNAIILATAKAIENGNDSRINYLENKTNGKVYGNIELKLTIEEK